MRHSGSSCFGSGNGSKIGTRTCTRSGLAGIFVLSLVCLGVGCGSGGSVAGTGTGGASGGATSASGGGWSGGGVGTSGGSSGTGGAGVIPPPAAGDQWVSPTGDDANPGTQGSPLKNLQTAVVRAMPGTTIWMMAGIHSYSARVGIKSDTVKLPLAGDSETSPIVGLARDGLKDKPTRIIGVAGTRPIVDFSPQTKKVLDVWNATGGGVPQTGVALTVAQMAAVTNRNNARGIALFVEYWYLKNLEIKNAGDNCIYIAGSYNTVEDVIVHECGDTGIQITGSEGVKTYVPSYNKILNCDSFLNIDDFPGEVTPGEDADGFAAKLEIGPGNEFRGCRSYQNSDDGWDLFQAEYAVVFDNCWAFDMKHPRATVNSDGNGFKLGGVRSDDNICSADLGNNKAPHKLTSCFGFYNPAWGFDLNNNSSQFVTCDKCGGWSNGKIKTPFEVYDENSGHTCLSAGVVHTNDVVGPSVTPEQARSAKRSASGDLPDISKI